MLIICFSKSATSDEFNASAVSNVSVTVDQHQSFGREPLFWDTARHVIICTWCEHAVGPSGLARHLQKFHGRILSLSARKELEACMPKDQAIEGDDKVKVHLAEQQGFSPHLAVYRDGHVCLHAGCGYASPKGSTMEKHLKKHNNMWDGHTEPQTNHPVPLSTVFGPPYAHYFIVALPDPGVETSASATTAAAALEKDKSPGRGGSSLLPNNPRFTQADMSDLRLKFQTHQQRQGEALAVAPLQTLHQTPWDIRTRWPKHFQGANMRQLHQLTQLNLHRDDPLGYGQTLTTTLETLLDRCQREAREHQTLILRILRTAKSGPPDEKPFRLVSQSTLQRKYATWWRRLLLLLLRVVRLGDTDTACAYVPISPPQQKLVQHLDHLLQTSPTVSSHHQPDADAAGERVLTAVKSLSQSLISVKVARSPLRSPLVAFVGCVGYEPDTGTWRRADETTPMLSGLLYIMRLLTLHSVLPVDDVDQVDDPPVILTKEVERYLRDGTASAFTELYSLRAYGKVIAKDFYQRPSVIWSKDQQVLTYKGDSLKMVDLAAMMQKLLADAEDLICEQLVFQDHGYLQTRHPGGLTDNWTWRKVGDSLIDVTQPDHLRQRDSYSLLHLALGNDQGRRLVVQHENSFTFNASGQFPGILCF